MPRGHAASLPPRPKGPTTLPTSTSILSGHPAHDPAALSSAVRTAPSGDSLHSRGGSPFTLQGGVAQASASASSSLGLSIAAMDLSVPPPVIEVDDLSSSAPTPDSPGNSSSSGANSDTGKSSSGKSDNRARRQRSVLDKGYDGETLQDKVKAQFHLDIPGRQCGPRDYLSGASVTLSPAFQHGS